MKHLATYKKKLNIHVFRDILTLKGISEKKKTDSIGKLYVSSRNGDIYIKGEGGQTESSLPSLSTRDPIKRLTKQTKGRLSWLAPGLRCLSPRVTAPEESHGSPATTERIPATRSSSRFAGNKKKKETFLLRAFSSRLWLSLYEGVSHLSESGEEQTWVLSIG